MRTFISLLLIAALAALGWFAYLYFTTPATYPDGSIGKIERFDTSAQHCDGSDGGCVTLTQETSVFVGDRLLTDETGRVRAVLVDETLITLAPETDLVIDTYVYKPRTVGSFLASLSRGAFRLVSGSMGSTSQHEMDVESPVGSIGVRGTDFVVRQLDENMDVVLIDGTVEVSNAAGSVTLSRLGDYAFITSADRAPEKRTDLSQGQIIELLSATTFDDEFGALLDPDTDFQVGER
ncbi:MAG: FecR family protein [Parvularcula sp.]